VTKREQDAEDLKLEIERSRELAAVRHDELIARVAEMETKVDELKRSGCSRLDCPQRQALTRSGDGLPVIKDN
jgi:hypothetical protein